MGGEFKTFQKKAGLWAYYYFFSLAASAHPTGLLHKSLAYKQVVGRELLRLEGRNGEDQSSK